jgi:pimeloyl-ACP methyl ester carboxylesterase
MTKLVLVLILIALPALALASPWFVPRPGLDGTIPEQPFADSRFAAVDGVRLHWRQRLVDAPDDRALVVLLHGFGGSTFSWRHTLDALEDAGHPAIAVDLPPFGYSQRTGLGPSWGELVRGLAERVAPGRELVVVGHSMGAGVAAEIAAAVPGRVRQLVFVDGTPGLRRPAGIPFAWALYIPSVRRALDSWAAWKLVDEDNIRRLLASALGRAPSDDELAGYFHPLTIPGTYPSLLVRMNQREGGVPEGWDRVPLAVVWGGRDDWVDIDRIRPWIADHPELRAFDTIAEAGHNPMDTHPDAFNDWLLAQLDAGP